jgi:hypothetical protein
VVNGVQNLELFYSLARTQLHSSHNKMPLDKFMRAPKSMAERAAEFRQNMLFDTRIRRGSGRFG